MRLPAPPDNRRLTAANPPSPGRVSHIQELFQECVDVATKAATSWICFALSAALNDGIGPPPTSTWCATRAASGFNWSRLGPTLPLEPAAFSVGPPPQPARANTCFPAVGSPAAPAGAVVVVVGVVVLLVWP